MTGLEAYRVLQKAWTMRKDSEEYPSFDDIHEALYTIKQDLDLKKELEQVWNNQEWCNGIPFGTKGLKSLFNYNAELFDNNLKLDEELNIFKLAFYILWKCCNSDEIATDIQKNQETYIEFKCGFESVCIPASNHELECIKKACELLDMPVKEEE